MAGGFNFNTWYDKNKQRLSQKKAERYKNDPAYRKACLEASRRQREGKGEQVKDEYSLSFNVLAEQLGVSQWTLREWRRKGYFPEPKFRNGRMWFTTGQKDLLSKLRDFFSANGGRVTSSKRGEMEELTNLVYANW